ncbi:anti-sigma factor A [Vibrio phage vB_VmeM-32]|nr:anti-sigma factor A [Vibrio phage vB_VmeM-32]
MYYNYNNNTKIDLIMDMIAALSILIKFDMADEILENQHNVVAFLDELGFKTLSGQKLTVMNFRYIISSLRPNDKNKVINEFKMAFESPKIAQLLVRP